MGRMSHHNDNTFIMHLRECADDVASNREGGGKLEKKTLFFGLPGPLGTNFRSNVFSCTLRRAATAREETCEDTLEMTKAFLAQSLNAGANVSQSAVQGGGVEGGPPSSSSSSR